MRGKIIENVCADIVDISVTDFFNKKSPPTKSIIFSAVRMSDVIVSTEEESLVGTSILVIKRHNANQGFELMQVVKVETTIDGEIILICRDSDDNQLTFSGTRIAYTPLPRKQAGN